ncbi:MAG TPA: helix-turn-helix domain-containing protein [Methylomirabilota bacterium]|nr:helix-turn-helix domain-containing protein [Methylomirabilota bacterium]
MNRNGTQRYRCQRCERYFTPKPEENWHDQQRRIEVQWRAVRLYLDGRSLRSIARQLGVHHQTVGRWVTAWTKDLREEAIKLYLESKSVYKAYLFLPSEVNFRTVSMWIRADQPQSLKEQALSLYLKKTSMVNVKRAIGVDDERTVRKWIRQANSEKTDKA